MNSKPEKPIHGLVTQSAPEDTRSPLLDLPEKVALQVFSMCDLPSILSLRKVCRDLRNFIDDNTFDCSVCKVSIEVYRLQMIVHIYLSDNEMLYPKGDNIIIGYKHHDMESMVARKHLAYGIEHTQAFHDDFRSILKYQKKPMDLLEVIICERTHFFHTFRHNHEPSSLKACCLKIETPRGRCPEYLDDILHVLDPDPLWKLQMDDPDGQVHLLGPGEQKPDKWKHLKELSIRGPFRDIPNFPDYLHLNEFIVKVKSICVQDIIAMKEAFLRSGPPKHCRLVFEKIVPSTRQMIQSLGPHYDRNNPILEWFFPTADANLFLEIRMHIYLFLGFEFVHKSNVPTRPPR